MNQVVVHTLAGQIIKGLTDDFRADRDRFHVRTPEGGPEGAVHEINAAGLKAVFFVRDLQGDPARTDCRGFPHDSKPEGKRVRVVFRDGETLLGTAQGYLPGRSGFFVKPADLRSNNERCYVLVSATREITLL